MRLKPVAVELDLMQPSVSGGRRLGQRRQHRLDKVGQGSLDPVLDRGRVGRLSRRRGPGLLRRPARSRFGPNARAVRLFDLSRLRRLAARMPSELVNRSAGVDRLWPLLEDIGFVGGTGEFIVPLDEKPVLALFTRLAVHPHEMPAPVELLAVQLELKMALFQASVRVPDRGPLSAVPDDDRAATILALGDRALEIGIFQRMIFDRDGEALLPRVQAWAAGHSPALEDPVQREAEVVVQSGRIVFLDDENIAVRNRRCAFRFGGRGEIALFPISFQRHSSARLTTRRGGLGLYRCASAGFFLGRSLAAWRSASGALAQRLQEVDGWFAGRWRALGDRLALKLEFDQLSQRVLVTILKLARIERALLGLDDVDGEIEDLAGNRLRWNLRERLLGRAHLIIVVQHRGGETLLESADENSPSAPKQDGFRNRRHFGLAHALAPQRESFGGAAVRGD